jgi:hypothetical protein
MKKGYDEKCGELAEYFLHNEGRVPEEVDSLAQTIQDAIEDWLNANVHVENER